MFENIVSFFKKLSKKNNPKESSTMAKERLHLVLMQDRANVSVDFLELMRREIIEVIKKYIDIDEKAIDVKLTNKTNEDGTVGAPALYANIPIITIKDEARKLGNAQANVIKDDKKAEVASESSNDRDDKDVTNNEVVSNQEENNQTNNKNVSKEQSNNDNVTEKTSNNENESQSDDKNVKEANNSENKVNDKSENDADNKGENQKSKEEKSEKVDETKQEEKIEEPKEEVNKGQKV